MPQNSITRAFNYFWFYSSFTKWAEPFCSDIFIWKSQTSNMEPSDMATFRITFDHQFMVVWAATNAPQFFRNNTFCSVPTWSWFWLLSQNWQRQKTTTTIQWILDDDAFVVDLDFGNFHSLFQCTGDWKEVKRIAFHDVCQFCCIL